MTNGVRLLLRFLAALFVTVTAVFAWNWYLPNGMGLMLGFMIAVPLAWRLLAAPIGELSRGGLAWLVARPAVDQKPRALEFDSIPVRVQDGDHGLRFRAEDVVAATKLQGIPTQGRGYVDVATLEKWLGKRGEPAAKRFLAWARKKK